nr:MAG TPA: hypothetical protein [Caudoviricetes sp.]
MKLTIRQMLESAGKTKMGKLDNITRALRMVSTTPIRYGDTAKHHLSLLEQNEPDILDMSIQDVYKPKANRSHWSYRCVTFMMTFLLTLMAMAILGTNIYISITKGVMLDWEICALVLSGPLAIVWHDRGLLRKESRDALLAMSSSIPLTFTEVIGKRFGEQHNRRPMDSADYTIQSNNPDGSVVKAEYIPRPMGD